MKRRDFLKMIGVGVLAVPAVRVAEKFPKLFKKPVEEEFIVISGSSGYLPSASCSWGPGGNPDNYLYSKELSRELRKSVQPSMRFRRFSDIKDRKLK